LLDDDPLRPAQLLSSARLIASSKVWAWADGAGATVSSPASAAAPRWVMAVAEIDGEIVPIEGYDVTPQGIIRLLKLDRPIYAETARWGHHGRGFSWG